MPHFVQSAPVLRKPYVKENLELSCETIEKIEDRAYMRVLLLFTAVTIKYLFIYFLFLTFECILNCFNIKR